MSPLDPIVEEVRAQLSAQYPVLVDSTEWSLEGDRVVASGGVLLPRQATTWVEALKAAFPEHEVQSPRVLSALDTPWQALDWRSLGKGSVADLHRSPGADDLQTQWEGPAWLRWFTAQAGRSLVQLPDGTLGWVDSSLLDNETPAAAPWADIVRPQVGAPVDVAAALDSVLPVARPRLGRPYLWGGNTAEAADCSGLVQSLLFQSTGVLLPKHTSDQRRFGQRVSAGGIEAGDLVFVRGPDQGLGHVGLALPSGEDVTVIHSCLTKNLVVEEPLSEFLERYRFTAARRVVSWSP